MELYYKTRKDCETGIKFSAVQKRADECKKIAFDFCEKHGFKTYRPGRESFEGGISSFADPTGNVDSKVWKRSTYGSNEYYPSERTKVGKQILQETRALPYVDIDELNNIVGYASGGWKSSHIGYCFSDSEYILFSVLEEWNVKVPSDCIEITGTEYKRIQGK